MGEIAEMMLEGLLCEGCGVCIDGGAPGHPRKCGECANTTAKPYKTALAELLRSLPAQPAKEKPDAT